MLKTLSFCFLLLFFFSCNTNNQKEVVKVIEKSEMGFVLPELPDKMTFCDQTIYLKDEDIKEKLDRELLVNTYFQSSTTQTIKRANRYFPIIEPILKKYGVPEDFKYVPLIESGFTANQVSPKGAAGLSGLALL